MNTTLRRLGAGVVLSTTIALSGCMATQPPLYRWDSFEAQIYGHFKGEAPEPQIAKLEEQKQKAASGPSAIPPGLHAHLGLLYAKVGNADAAQQCFVNEKTLYPESATFMDRLLAKFNPQGDRP